MSLDAIRGFESAARHLSFTAAAEELCITQSAVSKQVKSLEDLDTVFRRKVIPLLQEYFYEDVGKVRQALNDQAGLFIHASVDTVSGGFEEAAYSPETKTRYVVRSDPFPVEAYVNIYQS